MFAGQSELSSIFFQRVESFKKSNIYSKYHRCVITLKKSLYGRVKYLKANPSPIISFLSKPMINHSPPSCMRYSAASNKMITHQSYRGGQQHNLELPTSQKLYQNSYKKWQSQVLLVKGRGRDITKIM